MFTHSPQMSVESIQDAELRVLQLGSYLNRVDIVKTISHETLLLATAERLYKMIRMEDMDDELCHPLHVSCKRGHIDVVRYMLEEGVDPNVSGHYILSYTVNALHVAAHYGQYAICELLLPYMNDINNMVDFNGPNTALEMAVTENHLDVSSLLLENGADTQYAMNPNRKIDIHPYMLELLYIYGMPKHEK